MAKGLTREKLVKTALDIVDRDGLAGLSMRKLGAELGVDPMAAYRHLPNKDALLDGVVEAVMSEVPLDVDLALPWQDQLRHLARANLRTLLAHPNAAPLISQRALTTPASLRLPEKVFEILTAAGIPVREAGLTINTLGLLTSSIAMAEGASADQAAVAEQRLAQYLALPRDEFPVLLEALETGQLARSFEEVLDFAIDAVIAGLEGLAGNGEHTGTRG